VRGVGYRLRAVSVIWDEPRSQVAA
jgi:hypothetical protein